MNIFSKLTLKTLKENRTRTLVTIAGIIISAAMFTAITTLIVSLQTYMYNSYGATEGFFQGKILNLTQEEADKYSEYEYLENYFTARSIGYAEFEGIENEAKPYLFLLEPDEGFLEKMPVNVISGHLPQNDSEILIPNHLYTDGGVKLEMGQQITLQVGKRVSEGHYLWQDTFYDVYHQDENPEYIEKNFTKTYTVCGFYERASKSDWSFEPYSAPGYTAIVKDQNVQNVPMDFYYTMDTGRRAIDFYNEMIADNVSVRENTNLLLAQGAYNNDNFNTVLYSLAAILIAIIIFASVALIYNAFAISVSSRTRQFGLLSSIGATKRQMKSMVFREAVFLSLIGIPIGILCGLGGIGVTLYFIGDKFSFMNIGNESVKMVMDFSPVSIIAAAVIAFITVLISAYIPSKRCAGVTAIEAIRQNKDIKTGKHKEIKTSKLFGKIFGFNGMLAQKYMSRDKKKYRTITVSLAASVILIISSGAFATNLLSSAGDVLLSGNADLILGPYLQEEDNGASYFARAEKAAEDACENGYAEDYLTAMSLYLQEPKNNGKYKNPEDAAYVYPAVVFVSDEEFDRYSEKTGADPKELKDPENPKGILYAQADRRKNKETQKYQSYPLFAEYPDYISGYCYSPSAQNGEEKSFYVGAVADEPMDIFYNNSSLICEIYYPVSAMETLYMNEISGYSANVFFLSENTAALGEYLNRDENLVGSGLSIVNIAESTKSDRDFTTVIMVFAYGFITLIALIAVANVFNTVSTGIILRRKEFAMLKSVGMTDRGVVKILFLESFISGAKALFIGLPVSAAICLLIYKAIAQGFETAFIVPWYSIIGAVAGVFAVTFISMLYAANRLKKENILDSIRDENI